MVGQERGAPLMLTRLRVRSRAGAIFLCQGAAGSGRR